MHPRLSSQSSSHRGGQACGWLVVLLISGWVAAGCAGVPTREGQVTSAAPGKEQVKIEAVSFAFNPNRIKVKAGTKLNIRFRNTSIIGHNLTILSPAGKVVRATDLESGKSLDLSVHFPRKGTYPIYCDKFLHGPFGMEGIIEVY